MATVRRTAQASRIRQRLEAPISSHGSVQGIIHALYKEADRPYFQLRELSTFDLIRCEYSQSLYEQVIDALRHRRMTVHVAGPMKLDRASRSVVEMRAQRIEAIEPMSNDEFERFFGCAPEFTGDLSTEEYIEHARGHWDVPPKRPDVPAGQAAPTRRKRRRAVSKGTKKG